MDIGMVGLGRMGRNMAERLRRGGHTVVGFDADPEASEVASLTAMVEALPAPRSVWVMVPHGEPTAQTLQELATVLSQGDTVLEGGNSYYIDDQHNADMLGERGINYIDVGVSGGVWGLDVGYGLMVGGDDDVVERHMPIFDALRPAGERSLGFSHAGSVGAGHFAKMVHNGIEYGLMQAYAEGYELLAARDDLIKNPGEVIGGWREGTVVRSWLLDLLTDALEKDSDLDEVSAWADDSGEGRWTIKEAIDADVPVPVISAALFARYTSRQDSSPAMRAVAALRREFGGHATKPAPGGSGKASDPAD